MYCSPIIPAVWIEAFDSLDNLSYCFSISSSTTGDKVFGSKEIAPTLPIRTPPILIGALILKEPTFSKFA